MKTILLTNNYAITPKKIVESVIPDGFKLLMLDELSQEELLRKIEKADYLLASGRILIDDNVLARASKLKMIQRTGVGLDSLDIDSIRKRGIALYVNQGVNANSVAEHTLMLILSCLRRITEVVKNTKNGKWIKQAQGIKTRELKDKTVGIIGMGNIGKRVAQLLNAFGARVLTYTTPELTSFQEEELNVEQVSLHNLFLTSDIITLHCPLTPETKEIVRKDNIEMMKEGVIIINTARGGLINESDMLNALNTEKILYAGLDTYENEPPVNLNLIQHPHTITTPHIAGVTYDSFRQMMSEAMRNIKAFDEEKYSEIKKSKIL